MAAPVTLVVPTRGGREALRAIAEGICHERYEQLLVVLNREVPPDAEVWDLVRSRVPGAEYRLCPGGGVARARNLAMRVARNDIIVFADDDVQLPGGAVTTLVDQVTSGQAGVATARVVPAQGQSSTNDVYTRFLGLDRGCVSRTFDRGDLETLTPTTVWAVGVGAAFAVNRSTLDLADHPPMFDESLSHGRFCGGAEDVDFLLQCLHANVAVTYCAEAVVSHRYPDTSDDVAAKMRQYARADGAFYAKWMRATDWPHIVGDLIDWSQRLREHAQHRLGGHVHVPLIPLLHEPVDKLLGAAWWRTLANR